MTDPNTCWFYLIRHGATANNRAKPPRLQGRRTDPGLSDEGHEQAARTAQFLAPPCPIDAVFTSPLLRARQTAEAIATPHGLAAQIVEGLIEVDVGDWEGLSWEKIEQDHPEAYRAFMSDPGVNSYLGGETVGQVQARVIPTIEQLAAANLGRTIAIAAHNVVNRSYLAHLMGTPLNQYRHIPQDNCGINLLRHRNHRAKPVVINAVFHLAEASVFYK